VFRSWTPRSIVLTAGYHDIVIRKSGYLEHTTRVYVRGNSTQTITVTLDSIVANQFPVGRFTVTPLAPRVGETIQLDASASTDADGSISSYFWDFNGDGITDQTGRTATWQYMISGAVAVRLTVTDNRGATGQASQTLSIRSANQAPIALFGTTPSSPTVWSPVTLDGGASYDPDGAIATYSWDLDGDGVIDQTGRTVIKTYYTPATYWVTLFVTDLGGSTGIRSLPLVVGPSPTPGMPAMGNVPGVYVWGTDTWCITINGSPLWTTSRPYRIELRTDGVFLGASSGSGVAPMGLVPTQTSEGWKLILEGNVGITAQTYTFQAAGATSIYMDLALDTDGDGYVNRSTGFVRFGQSMVGVPRNPIVVGKPDGYFGALTPNLNYKMGSPMLYSETSRLVFYFTTIGALAGTP
jgi:chitodextrinase